MDLCSEMVLCVLLASNFRYGSAVSILLYAQFSLPLTLSTPSGENHNLIPALSIITDELTSDIDLFRFAGDPPGGSGL